MTLRAKLLGLNMVQNTLQFGGSPSPAADESTSAPPSPTSSGASSPMTPGSIKKSKKAIKKKASTTISA